MARETVLIIDDSAELRSVLESILPFGGYQVLSAGTGKEGLAWASKARPDLIMVDLELPDTNGLKVLEKLNEQGLTTPTIMMTGYGSEGVAARALRLGVKDYLIKPFTTEEVLSSVERALAESRLRREKERLEGVLTGYARHCKLVSAIGRTMIADLNLAAVLQRIVAAGLFIARADAAFLLLEDPASRELRLVAAEGEAKLAQPPSFDGGDERLAPVLQQCAAARLHATDNSLVELQTQDRTWAVLQVPLRGQQRAIGLLSVDRRSSNTPFTWHDEQMLVLLADFAVMAMDLDRRREEVRASRQEMDKTLAYLVSVADLLRDPVLIVDPQGHVQFVNAALAHLVRQPAQEMLGRHLSELFEDTKHGFDLRAWAGSAADKEGRFQVPCRLSREQRLGLVLRFARIPDFQGDTLGLLSVAQVGNGG